MRGAMHAREQQRIHRARRSHRLPTHDDRVMRARQAPRTPADQPASVDSQMRQCTSRACYLPRRPNALEGHLIRDQLTGDERRPRVPKAAEDVGDSLTLRAGNQQVRVEARAQPRRLVVRVSESGAFQDEGNHSTRLETRQHTVQLPDFYLVQDRFSTKVVVDPA